MMANLVTAYKLARPDGWDFYTGKAINYRGNGKYPHKVVVPNGDTAKGICSSGVGHASGDPNDCFVGATIPCSAYRLRFEPVCGDSSKWGFLEADVLEEITDLDTLFGWRYSEAIHPLNPFRLPKRVPTGEDLALLDVWNSVWDSVRESVRNSVWDSVRESVRESVRNSVWDSALNSVWGSVRESVWDSAWDSALNSVGDSAWNSVWDSVGAYTGSLFSGISVWKNGYPYQSTVDLWRHGLVPSYDGKVWRLHSGPKAEIVWQQKTK